MRSEIPYPKPIHPRDNTWHYKSEHLCSIRKFLLELPKWPVPFVPVKERTTPLPMLPIRSPSAWRSIVASWVFPATQGSPTAFSSTPARQELPVASPQVDCLHLQRGAMPRWQDDYIQKKRMHFFVDTSLFLLIETFPNTTDSFLLSFMSKGTSLILLRPPSLPKDSCWWTWLREASLSVSCPFQPKDWDASSWLC